MPGSEFLYQILNFVVSFLIITGLFALMFKYLPDAKIAWGDVWLGAAVTALLFTIGKQLIGLYLGNSNFGSTFGAFGSLIIILVWIYYSAQILFFGAEFTQVYANMFGSRVVPEEHAVRTTEGERAQQGLERREEEKAPAHQATSGFTPGFSLQEAPAVSGAGTGNVAAQPQPVVRVPMYSRPAAQKPASSIQDLAKAVSPYLVALGIWAGGSLLLISQERKAIKKGEKLPGQDQPAHPQAGRKVRSRRGLFSRRK